MRKILFIIAAFIMPLAALAQKGKHFEFNYFALELGSFNSFSGAPGGCTYKYFVSQEGNMHVLPVKGACFTPGYNAGFQFHHDFQNDKAGLVLGLSYNSWGNTAKYQSENKKIMLTECNRVSSLVVPLFMKLGQEIYNEQAYFYFGTQVGINFDLVTSQSVNVENGKRRTNIYKEGLNKISVPIVIGFNYTILNFRFGLQPKGFFNKDYEYPLENGDIIKPFENMNKATVFANVGFLIPLSQWTVKRSFILSRIF